MILVQNVLFVWIIHQLLMNNLLCTASNAQCQTLIMNIYHNYQIEIMQSSPIFSYGLPFIGFFVCLIALKINNSSSIYCTKSTSEISPVILKTVLKLPMNQYLRCIEMGMAHALWLLQLTERHPSALNINEIIHLALTIMLGSHSSSQFSYITKIIETCWKAQECTRRATCTTAGISDILCIQTVLKPCMTSNQNMVLFYKVSHQEAVRRL